MRSKDTGTGLQSIVMRRLLRAGKPTKVGHHLRWQAAAEDARRRASLPAPKGEPWRPRHWRAMAYWRTFIRDLVLVWENAHAGIETPEAMLRNEDGKAWGETLARKIRESG